MQQADKALRHEMAMAEAAGLRSWSTSRVAVQDSMQGTALRRLDRVGIVCTNGELGCEFIDAIIVLKSLLRARSFGCAFFWFPWSFFLLFTSHSSLLLIKSPSFK